MTTQEANNESKYQDLVDVSAGGFYFDFTYDIANIGLATMSEPQYSMFGLCLDLDTGTNSFTNIYQALCTSDEQLDSTRFNTVE